MQKMPKRQFLIFFVLLTSCLAAYSQSSYYVGQARSYMRDAEYYISKAESYDRDADYYEKKAKDYLREAEYYSRNKQ